MSIMPMIDPQVLAFTAIAAVLTITPGSDTMLVIKNSLRSGTRGGHATTYGILSGTLFHALVSALGLSVILTQSALAFQIVQTVGNVLNPKVALFYMAFLPQFISPSDPVLAKSVLLATIHNGLSLLWLGGISLALGRGQGWIQRPQIQAWLTRTSGLILIGFGLRLALSKR